MPDFDGSYKLMFRNREFVRDTLRSVLRKKKKWIELVDWDSLEPFPTEQLSDKRLPTILIEEDEPGADAADEGDEDRSDRRAVGRQARRFDDDVWRVKYGDGGEWLYFYLAFEFQSTVDRWMAARAQTYRSLLQERIIALNPAVTRLPRGMVIVVYNGTEPWTVPSSLKDEFEPMPPGFEEFEDPSAYLLVSIEAVPADELEPSTNFFDLLTALEQCSESDEAFGYLAENYPRLRDADLWRPLGAWLVQSLSSRKWGVSVQKSDSMLDNIEEYFGMFSQTMEKKYEKIAAEGEARGKAEGKVESIIEVLAAGPGPLDAESERSLRAISDLARLTELTRLAATCVSLEEFAAALKE